ncbi:MAG: bifunctional folylpolyglutamate synthase/dihydrofolate synthase [Hyphomicrobiales bacterium]|nr:bifunctional folylpolyglutamate synthase/dihydrofolate synthase [Hyphomicrobiales bacterium]
MNQLDAILARLLELHPRKIDLSLGRTLAILEKIGDPQKRLPKIVHIAGTNGKGSTLAFLRAILEAAGQRVHCYTSPHLVRFNERIRLAGELVDDATLIEALEYCERANAGAPITFFEITTAAAFRLFAQVPADWLLLEVGLGGRFDSTNVIDHPAAAIVTPVSLDHAEFLGDTVEKIAHEKAGIFKKGAPAIIGYQSERPERVLIADAMRADAPVTLARRDFDMREESGRLIFEDARGLMDLPLPRLAGRHQHENAATAIAALRIIAPQLDTVAYERGLQRVEWPARLQLLTRGALTHLVPPHAELWLDGGHNEDGARVVAAAMAEMNERKPAPLALVCGTLATKDARAMLGHFADLAQEVVAVPVSGDHYGRAPADVAAAARALGLKAHETGGIAEALRMLAAREWRQPPRILICGSLYLAGEALRLNGAALT